MTKTMNVEALAQMAASLPELPTVYATNMLYAQGWSASEADQKSINARREFLRAAGVSMPVSVEVRDPYTSIIIGHLTFTR